MLELRIPRHVYLCVTAGHVIFLDVRRDRYFALEISDAQCLTELVAGWPIQSENTAGESSVLLRGGTIARRLLTEGLLVSDQMSSKTAVPETCPAAHATLQTVPANIGPHIRVMEIILFLRASLWSVIALKVRSLSYVIQCLQASRARAMGREVQADTLIGLLASYRRLRSLLFTSKNACLYDSLVLRRFLEYYGFFPLCIIGVKTGPFRAHAWVQEGDTVLNDVPECVCEFTPVLVV